MRKVIDSNQLQSKNLLSYLSKSSSNFAVLTDYAAMEAYKGNTTTSIFKSMEIISDFPKQAIVLKSTRVICGLNGCGVGLQKRFIDNNQTREFAKFAHNLNLAKTGNQGLINQLLEHGKEATAHFSKMLGDANSIGIAIDDIANLYTKDERRLIRTQQPYTAKMIDRIVKAVIQVAGDTFKNHPSVRVLPSYQHLPNTFIFRLALCTYLLALDWAASGSARNANAATLRNDMVDMNFAAYGTYFDGILSDDAKVVRIHQEARLILSALFKCHLHDGITGKT